VPERAHWLRCHLGSALADLAPHEASGCEGHLKGFLFLSFYYKNKKGRTVA